MITQTIPALTLRQPWASLIARGGKLFETRTWAPPASLIGQRLAIHAGRAAIPLGLSRDERTAIHFGLGTDDLATLPRGAVVCTAKLVGAYRVASVCVGTNEIKLDDRVPGSQPLNGYIVPAAERLVGDVLAGYWLWHLMDVQPLDPPMPAMGRQGLWKWAA
jgi:activating signal cointegrator 1